MENPHSSHSLGRSLCIGVACGASGWAAYASVEAFLAGVAPRLLPEGYMRPLHNWQFAAVIFAIWVLGGALLGAAMGLLEWWMRRRRPFGLKLPPSFLPSCTALSVTAVLTIHLSRPYARGEVGTAALALCGLVAILQFGGVVSDAWARRTAFLANSWAASAIVLGSLWVAWTFFWGSGELARWLVAGGAAVIVGSASWLMWRALRRVAPVRSPLGHAPLAGAAALSVLGAAIYPPATASLGNLGAAAAPSAVQRPNVVLVVWDTVRADHLSVYGYERDTTPFLREFARGATLYRRAWSTGDMTLISHASLFTGLYGTTHGAHPADPDQNPEGDFGSPLAGDRVTLAEVLGSTGYRTAGLVANHVYLSEAYGLHQGFRYYEVSAPFWGRQRPFFLRQPLRTTLVRWFKPEGGGREFSDAAGINRRAFAILDRMARAQPFFLFVNYMDAHGPYTPPAPFDRMFDSSSGGSGPDLTEKTEEVLALERSLTVEERAYFVARYDGSIAYLDSEFRRLVGKLRGLGLYHNTLIVLTSDHGEAFGRRHHLTHGMSVYENQARVPLLIKYPGQRAAVTVGQPASLVDVFPTVLEASGVRAPRPVEGVALRNLERAGTRVLYAESFPKASLLQLHPRFRRVERAAIRWPYKLIVDSRGKRELYNLESNPAETRNLYSQEPAVAASLLGELERRFAGTRRRPAGRSDPEMLRRLKSLGYAQ